MIGWGTATLGNPSMKNVLFASIGMTRLVK